MGDNGDVSIPGFRIERELGRGAMGVVYLAHEQALGRDVALKVLRPGYGEGDREEARARFAREIRASARLDHPNIVPILSTGEAQGRLWYAMQYVPGQTLDTVLETDRRGRLGKARTARIVRDIALALHAAHENEVVHRDVKPGNVMLLTGRAPEGDRSHPSRRMRRSWLRDTDEGAPQVYVPMLTDFGLAADRTASKLSESGMLIGTPGYMAPEQYRGQADAVGPHSDQWALGVMLYECLTGTMPFPTGDLALLARMITHEDPIPPSRLDPRIDRDLETICLKTLSKTPGNRYPDCSALAEDLGHWLREEPISARPPSSMQRIQSWARRRPARATALVALFLVLLGAMGLTIGIGIRNDRKAQQLRRDAQSFIGLGEYERAERVCDEWIALDPGAGDARDMRANVRALRGIAAARARYAKARAEIERMERGRAQLKELEARLLQGSPDEAGGWLGSEVARGSEPWWMREPGYRARRKIDQLREQLAQQWADISSDLAIARSLAEANAEAAGPTGESLRDEIRRGAAAWHMRQWRYARQVGDAEREALHREAVLGLDPKPHEAELSGIQSVQLLPLQPPAEGWLFCFRREGDVIAGGGPRLLPIPYDIERGVCSPDIPEVFRAAVAARLEGRGHRRVEPDVPMLTPPLRSSATHIETLTGRMRRSRYEELLASTAYELVTDGRNALGRVSEPRTLQLPRGRYILLWRREGLADLRAPFAVGAEAPPPVLPVDGLDLQAPPPGFRIVTGGPVRFGSDDEKAPNAAPRRLETVASFLAARFEITNDEYWEFLNDPRTLAEIERHLHPTEEEIELGKKPELRFVPRTGSPFEDPRDAALPIRPPNRRTGPFEPMDNWEHPVSHLCLYDLVGYLTPPEGETEPHDDQYAELAEALKESGTVGWGYLRWRTERSRERARAATAGGAVEGDVAVVRTAEGGTAYRALRFTLPTQAEWERMARGADDRIFVYGDEREWTHFKGARSRPHHPAPEAVGLFPEDESVFGIRDLTGSAAEWTADWVEEGDVFWVKGHAWGSQTPENDRIAARRAVSPGPVTHTVGVRIIARVLEEVR